MRRTVQAGGLALVVLAGTVIIVHSRQGTETLTTVAGRQTPSSPATQGSGSTRNPLLDGSLPPTNPLSPPPSDSVLGSPASGSSSAGRTTPGSVAASRSGTGKAPAKTRAAAPVGAARTNQPGGTTAVQMYGNPRSGLAWHSGFWLGGTKSTGRMNSAGDWRGRPMDFATAYPLYGNWSEIADPSSCIGLFAGFKGRLALGLPMLPSDRAGQWDDILSGAHDGTFRAIARNMKAYGFGDSAVRVGLEASGDWFPWAANSSNAAQYKAAFRRIVGIMRAEAPQLSFWFDTNVTANPFSGGSGRGTMLEALYPGGDVVDGVSMDHYDFYSVVARNAAEFAAAMRPPNGTGLADAVDFARKHGKGFAVPEWGLHAQQGAGDNPYFIQGMHQFFVHNKDVLVFEDYFNEDASYIGASIWDPVQNPQSSAVYKQLWGG